MSRGAEFIEFVSVAKADVDSPCSTMLRISSNFDVRDAECFNPQDKLKFLQIIRAACGDLVEFNRAVVKTLQNGAHVSVSEADTNSGCGDLEASDTDSELTVATGAPRE